MIITELHIVDWYDDMITSVTSLEDEVYLFHCIQKDFITGNKLYYCVKIDEESVIQIKNVIEKENLSGSDWDAINLIFKKNNNHENVFLLKAESLSVGSAIIFNKVEDSELIHIKFPFDVSTLYAQPDSADL